MVAQTRNVQLQPSLPEIIGKVTGRKYAVVCGANNSGKSYLLKLLKRHIGRTAYFVGPARFYHLSQINSNRRNDQEYDQYETNFNQNANNTEYNFDQNTIGLDRIITNLTDKKRRELFEICGELIGVTFRLKNFEDDNKLSPFYIDMDGQNISIGSSGTRVLMTLIGLCMDTNFNSLLIDEPELGLGPKVQASVARFLADAEQRAKFFPHLNNITVATHSNLFLDRADITNNFSVVKEGDKIELKQIQTFGEYHDLQFNLLGNSLESLFLPSAFIFVEGKTDAPYITKLVKANFKERNIVVIPCHRDVKGVVNRLKESLHDLAKSPFRSRIFVIIDSIVPDPSLKNDLEAMGLLRDNIVQWSKNGIEYYYPQEIMSQIFSCDPARLNEIVVEDDNISLNGKTVRKADLSALVCLQLESTTQVPDEVENKLLSRLRTVLV